jgi:DHA1 family multidrug resistance protein-like MFS transporter
MLKNSKLAILFFTMVVVMLGFGIIIPIIPFYVTRFGAGGSELGMLMAVFSVMQFLFSPLWGSLSDRYGRKKILMVGAFGNAVSMLVFGLADNMALLFLSRALAGVLSSATLPTAMAYISDSTSERDRGQGMGLIGAAMGVGMVLGPGLGGWMGAISLSAPFFLAAGLSTVAMLLILAILPETLPDSEREAARAAGGLHGPQFSMMWKALMGPLGFLLFLAFLVNFGLANFEGIFGLYTKDRFGYGPEQVGTIMTVIGVVSVLIQGVLTGPLTRRLGEEKVINLSLIGSALGFAIMLAARSFAGVLATVGFFVFTNAMLRPAIASLTSKRTQGGQGMAMGLNNSFQSLGRVVGPLWAGFLYDVNLTLPYTSAAVIMGLTFLMGIYWLRAAPPTAPEVTLGGQTGD